MLNVTKSDAFYTCMGSCVCVEGVFFWVCECVLLASRAHANIFDSTVCTLS